MTKPIISIAGTVGIGKSTLTHRLADALSFETSLEKVENNPYLDSFYKDFERWSFHLQIFFLSERFKEQKKMVEKGGGFIQDRSIYEDTSIFAKMLYDQGNMSEEDYKTYHSLFEAMVLTPYFPKPDLLIYITGDFDEVLRRIQSRGRNMEKDTPVEYWSDLYRRYDQWISTFNECPVIRLNIQEYDLIEDPSSIDDIAKKVKEGIKK